MNYLILFFEMLHLISVVAKNGFERENTFFQTLLLFEAVKKFAS